MDLRIAANCLLAAGLMLVGTPAFAQQAPSARDANIYDGKAHEPDPAATTAREKAAGIAPSAETRQRENDKVEQLYRTLEHKSAAPPD